MKIHVNSEMRYNIERYGTPVGSLSFSSAFSQTSGQADKNAS